MTIVHIIRFENEQQGEIIRMLKQLLHKTNEIAMTQAEATQALNDLTAQVAKVKTEVEALIAAATAGGNVTPELEVAIANAKAALQGVDDLNPDA